jgi:HD-GYP domain-containing protein (c-di-GMP phosphodiesterase class II)
MEQVRAGMKLAVTVSHPEQPEHDLLKPGFELNDDVIGRLKGLGVETIYVDYPDLSDLDRHMAGHLSPARQQVYNQIRNTMQAVQKQAKPSVPFADYYACTRELILTLMQQGEHAIYLDQMSGKLGGHAVAHATAVAHLSLMLGIRLETYLVQQRSRLDAAHARETVNLGVAAMLHDIGVAQLPPALRNFSRVNMPEDEKLLGEWRTHPQRGYDLIRGGVEATAASAVLHHHQHFDGSGFPAPELKPGEEARNVGERIHIFARILAAADVYDRLTATETGQRRQNVEILYLMRTRYAAMLDPMILKALPAVIPPFPPGMLVTLSDGTDAVVVAIKPERPYHPQVRRIEDPATLKLGGATLDMALQTGLKIDRVAGLAVGEMVPELPTAKAVRAA